MARRLRHWQDTRCIPHCTERSHLAADHRRPPVPALRCTEPAYPYPAANPRHPSRQQRRVSSLDTPQCPPEQTEDDKRSARQACREANEILLKDKYGAAVEVSSL